MSAKKGMSRARAERTAAKRAAIIDGATACFLHAGYAGTSVDQIADRAGVSKQTVYEHFGGKEQLFIEIVMGTIDDVGQPFFDRLHALEATDTSEHVEAFLRVLARELAAVVKQPRLLDLRRLVIAEVTRFPQLGRAFAERGPGRTVDALAARFERLDHDGVLRVADPHLAAQHFNWLVLSIPINRAMFDPSARFTQSELDHLADEAVRVFLAAYAPLG
jgi:TetR/AcrR family transcriptional regulator, mexJK operon transcriptional repressor